MDNIIRICRESMILGFQILIGGFVFEEIIEEAEEIIDWSLVGIVYSSILVHAVLSLYRIGLKSYRYFTKRSHATPTANIKCVEQPSDMINITFRQTVF
jgi:hypothetical protein